MLFLDRLTAAMVGDDARGRSSIRQAHWLHEVMGGVGLADDYVLLTPDERGPAVRARLLDRLGEADLLLNVNGFLDDAELLAAPRRTAFVDIDPGFQQMWVDLGLAGDLLGRHDLFFTVGANIGAPGCGVPTCGVEWIATRPPVVLDDWPATETGVGFTSVGSWRGPYGPIEYGGETYGLRVHEFRRFVACRAGLEPISIALDVDEADGEDVTALLEAGWKLLDPEEVAGQPSAYGSFIRGSAAEMSIAKNVYVRSTCGWFSDRSACYLASGRPVLAQDTGFSAALPRARVCSPSRPWRVPSPAQPRSSADWPRHSRAARGDRARVLRLRHGAGEDARCRRSLR